MGHVSFCSETTERCTRIAERLQSQGTFITPTQRHFSWKLDLRGPQLWTHGGQDEEYSRLRGKPIAHLEGALSTLRMNN